MKRFVATLGLTLFLVSIAFGQIKRERSPLAQTESEPFWASSTVILPTVTQLPASNLNFTIQHAFGLVSGGISELFGLDASANIRFGLDYGVTDRVSVGVGRSRFDKVVDVRAKVRLATIGEGKTPWYVSVFGNAGMDTQKNGYDLADRASFYLSALVAKPINEKMTIQISPAWTHFNLARENVVFGGGTEKEEGDIVSVGFSGRYAATQQVALVLEYIPVFGARSDGTRDAISVGVDLETGGHIFQLFVTSTQWITPQYVVSRSRDNFLDGDFGFGFTVHRVF